MKNLKRTKNNDLVFGSSLFSVQNIIFICSVIMILFYFFAFMKFKYEILGQSFRFKLSLFQITFFNPGLLGDIKNFVGDVPGGALSALRIFFISLLLPLVNIGLYLLNMKKFDKTKSYNIVSLQYALIVGFGILNFILISMISGAFAGSGMGLFRVTVSGNLYKIANFIIILLAFVGIIFTGDREIDETIVTKDITSKKVMNEAKASAMKMSKDVKVMIKQETGLYCTSCGSKNPKDSNFCKTCGSKIEKEETKLEGITAQIKEKATELKDNIVIEAEKIGEKVDVFVAKAEERVSEIKENIKAEVKEVSDDMKADAQETAKEIGEKAEEVVAKAEERASEIKENIKAEVKEVSDDIKADAQETIEGVEKEADKVVVEIKKDIEDI